jgi:hypothetical protein
MFSTNKNVASLINAEVDKALDTLIPSSNTTDSVNDILLDKLEPLLPGTGTLSVLSEANINTQVDNALNTVIPTSNTVYSSRQTDSSITRSRDSCCRRNLHTRDKRIFICDDLHRTAQYCESDLYRRPN